MDEELEVLEIRGKASRFLSLPSGKMSFNLLKLIPETGLFLEVEKLVHQVRRRATLRGRTASRSMATASPAR